jgi:iron complex transport system substrate-binding protein
VIDEAGAINIANALPLYWQRVSPEWLVQQDPGYLVLSPNLGGYGYEVPSPELMHSLWRETVSRPGIRSMRLAREKHLYLLNSRLGYGLRSFVGAIYLAKVFHPQLFLDLNPQQVHARFLRKFFSLQLEGSYIYP